MRAVVGLMSGTSLDGVDAALVRTDGERIGALGPAATTAFPAPLRAELRGLLDLAPGLDAADPRAASLGRRLAELYAEAVRGLGCAFDLVGMHGQTILHRPREGRTWQIGDADHLARLLGCEVVHDFRAADLRAGGQGAPLVPLFHAAMLPEQLERPVLVLNVGGVANLTWIGGGGAIAATDTGPGNALLDDWMARRRGAAFDADGSLAASGRPDAAFVERLVATDPFFRRPSPRALDRQDFAGVLDAIAPLGDADGAATLAWLTARAVAAAPLPAPPRRILVCGGGRRNRAILAGLARAFAVPVDPVEAIGWDGDALEAQCFAYLAVRSARGLPLSLPATTGVPSPTTGGRIARPAR